MVVGRALQAVGGGGGRRRAGAVQPARRRPRGARGGRDHAMAERAARSAGGFADVDITYRAASRELRGGGRPRRARRTSGVHGDAGRHHGAHARSRARWRPSSSAHGDRYDVRVQLPDRAAHVARTLIARAQVRTRERASWSTSARVGEIRESSGPSQIDRQARQRQVTVLASLDGKALGDALERGGRHRGKEVPARHRRFAFGGLRARCCRSRSRAWAAGAVAGDHLHLHDPRVAVRELRSTRSRSWCRCRSR